MTASLPQAELDDVFSALANPTRRGMLRLLAQEDQTIGELAAPFAITFAGASKHVRVLEEAGLLVRTVRGRVHVCSLEGTPLVGAADWLATYTAFWTRRLDALERQLLEFPDE